MQSTTYSSNLALAIPFPAYSPLRGAKSGKKSAMIGDWSGVDASLERFTSNSKLTVSFRIAQGQEKLSKIPAGRAGDN